MFETKNTRNFGFFTPENTRNFVDWSEKTQVFSAVEGGRKKFLRPFFEIYHKKTQKIIGFLPKKHKKTQKSAEKKHKQIDPPERGHFGFEHTKKKLPPKGSPTTAEVMNAAVLFIVQAGTPCQFG